MVPLQSSTGMPIRTWPASSGAPLRVCPPIPGGFPQVTQKVPALGIVQGQQELDHSAMLSAPL
jgi:hypothetical protein